jgi:hypothetical protein
MRRPERRRAGGIRLLAGAGAEGGGEGGGKTCCVESMLFAASSSSLEHDPMTTDKYGRTFITEGQSPDGKWRVQIYGPNAHHDFMYAYAQSADCSDWSFGLGRTAAAATDITFQWDLPNGSWGVFINGECWAVYANRPSLRIHAERIYSRRGAHAVPYSNDEIRFICAKRRGQRKGTKGYIIEE